MAFTKAQLDAYIQALYDDDGQLSSNDYQLIINYILSNGEPETDPRDLIQVRRGNFADLPNLAQGELAFTLDTQEVYIGGLSGNVSISASKINVRYFETVSAMIASPNLKSGEFVLTLGYHSVNDGGGAAYLIVDAGTGTADGGILIDLTGSNKQAKIQGAKINTRQLGLVANDQCQDKVNDAIWREETKHLVIKDPLRVQKTGSGTTDIAQILPKSNFTLEFEEGSKLTLFPTPNEDYYRMISIEENRGRYWDEPITYHKENITIIRPVLYGDREITAETVGEYGHGLYIAGDVENITVIDPECYDMFGDGYDVGGGRNIRFLGRTYAENCRRQGMSVIKVDGMELEYLHAKKIDGTAPFSAIDFEPNFDGNDILNVHVGKIYAEDVYRALLVVGASNKQITVDEIITDQTNHSAIGYGEVEIHGNDKYTDVKIGSLLSKNAKDKNILLFRNTNEKVNVEIGSVRADNYYKTSAANVVTSATVLFEYSDVSYAEAGRVKIGQFSMINPTNETTKFDYYLRLLGTATAPALFKDINIPIQNPLTSGVESNITSVLMENCLIGYPNFQPDNNYHYFGADVITIEPLAGKRYISNPPNMIKIDNPKLVQFYLGYRYYEDYVLDKAYTDITQDIPNKLWNITNFNGLIVFDHVAKTITFKKVAFDATY